MEEESFTTAYMDMPEDLAGKYSQLFVFRTEDFGAWYRRVRDAHEREVDGGVDAMTDAELAEHGLVRMPEDADGVPIHVGDSIEIIGGEDGTAVAIELCEDGGWNVSMRPTGWDTPTLFAAESVRHRHEPTVEDVLREFTDEVWNRCCEGATASDSGIDELVAECAAKLQLREE